MPTRAEIIKEINRNLTVPRWTTKHWGKKNEVSVFKVFESSIILWTLQECDGCREQAADLLGISRRGLCNKIKGLQNNGFDVPPSKAINGRYKLREDFWKILMRWAVSPTER
jgi:DNA-binding NtrC family response regulator